MTRVCALCKEPTKDAEQITIGGTKLWLCQADIIRLREKVRARKAAEAESRRSRGEVASLMARNGTKDRRYGSENVWQGPDHADEWLDAEEIPS